MMARFPALVYRFSKTYTFYPWCIRVHPWPKNQTSKADRTPKKTTDLATDGHGYTRMRIAGFLALHREKIGTKLYGYVLAKRYTSEHWGVREDRFWNRHHGRLAVGRRADSVI